MVEEYTEYQVCVGGVLDPILAPRIAGEVICACGETSDETTFLCFGLAFEGGLVAVSAVSVHGEDVDGFSMMVVVVVVLVHVILRGCRAGHIIVSR